MGYDAPSFFLGGPRATRYLSCGPAAGAGASLTPGEQRAEGGDMLAVHGRTENIFLSEAECLNYPELAKLFPPNLFPDREWSIF